MDDKNYNDDSFDQTIGVWEGLRKTATANNKTDEAVITEKIAQEDKNAEKVNTADDNNITIANNIVSNENSNNEKNKKVKKSSGIYVVIALLVVIGIGLIAAGVVMSFCYR